MAYVHTCYGNQSGVTVLRSVAISLLAGAATLLPILATGCGGQRPAREAEPEVIELSQGTFTAGDFPLQIELRDEPRILALRRQERLDQVVAGIKGDYQIFLKLMSWTRAQFEPGIPDPYPLSNGLSILADIRAGRTGGFCGQYSYLLGDALKSFGYFAVRYVELESESGESHFAVEAWSNELGRWLVLDPLYAAVYLKDGVPQSSVELHQLLLMRRASELRVERVPFTPARLAKTGGAPPPPSDAELLSRFYNVAVSTRNDFARLDHPLTIAEREGIFLRFGDPRVAPFRHLDFALLSARKEDFLAPMNQVAIELRPDIDPALMHVIFSTRGTCPHFARYRFRLGGTPWKDSGPVLGWKLAPGDNLLEVRAVNAFEIEGPVFHVKIRA